MDDEPRFPSPEEAKAHRASEAVATPSPARDPGESTSGAPPPPAPTPPRSALRVARPDPPPDDAPKPGGLALTREEVHALLAVSGANQPKDPPTRLGKLWRRGRIVFLPTSLLSTGLHLAFGDAAWWAIGPLVVLSFAWTARPLLRRDEWS